VRIFVVEEEIVDNEAMRKRFKKEQRKWAAITGTFPEEVLAPEGGFATGIGCMDERVVRMAVDDPRPPMIRLAGSGILLSPHISESCNMVVALVKKYRLETISYHRDCGAGAAMATQLGTDALGDQTAKSFVDRAAEVAGIKAVCAPLDRIPHHHDAVGHIYSAVPVAPHVADLPAMFVTSRFAVDAQRGKKELVMAAQIAFGPHGFGGLFTPDQPYTIAVVGIGGLQYLYKREAEEVKADLPSEIRDCVRVHTFGW